MIRLSYALAFAALASCVVESGKPPLDPGDGLVLDPATNQVGVDPKKVPLLTSSCANGTVAAKVDGKWQCLTPAALASESIPSATGCLEGQVVARSGSGWACAANTNAETTPVVEACAAGQFVTRTATGWACAIALDPVHTPVVSACPDGQFVKRAGTGWTCAVALDESRTPVVEACTPGTFVTRTADGWACAAPLDPLTTPLVAGCANGRFVRRAGAGWDCALPLDPTLTPVLSSCTDGQFITHTPGGWACAAAPGVDPDKTPIVGTCPAGQYVRKGTTAWECAALEGNLTGNVTGNLTGNVTGNLTGNVTGNVSGTAAGVTGIVPLANGGTGTATLLPRGLPLVNAAGTAFTGLAPGATGTLLASDQGEWRSKAPRDLALARRTSGALNLFVRTDGNDECDGLGSGAGTTKPCAVATLARAADLIPEFVEHPVTVSVAAGTYRSATANAVAFELARVVSGLGTISLNGSGLVVISGATVDGGPSVGSRGLVVNGTRGVAFTNLTVERFVDSGILVQRSEVRFDSITSQSNGSVAVGGHGIICQYGALCSFVGTSTTTATNNAGSGLYARFGSNVALAGPLNVTANTSWALGADYGSAVNAQGAVTANNLAYAVLAGSGSWVYLFGGVTATNLTTYGLVATERGTIQVSGATNISVNSGGIGILSQYSSWVNFSPTANSQLNCASGTGTFAGISQYGSTLTVGPPAANPTVAISSTGCGTGFLAQIHGTVWDNAVGNRSFTLSPNTVTNRLKGATLSLVNRGAFGAGDTSCASGALCQ